MPKVTKTIQRQVSSLAGIAVLIAGMAFLAVGCGGEDPSRIARQKRTESEMAQLELERRGKAQAVDAQLQRLNQLIVQMEQTHQAQMRETQAQAQKLAVELDELKRSLNMEVAPTVATVPEVPDEVVAPAAVAPPQRRVEDYRAQPRPYSFMARLFFLVILLLAVGLIFHVVMSRVQEEEDDEGEDKLYQTEEGTISLSPKVQRESREFGGGKSEPGPEV